MTKMGLRLKDLEAESRKHEGRAEELQRRIDSILDVSLQYQTSWSFDRSIIDRFYRNRLFLSGLREDRGSAGIGSGWESNEDERSWRILKKDKETIGRIREGKHRKRFDSSCFEYL